MVVLQAHLEASLQKLKKHRADIEKGISMFEAAKDNHCNEYSPWSYNLLGGGSITKTILDDDDGQDLNNSMVNELVAKILDDDCVSSNVFNNRCNGNSQQYQSEASLSQDCKTRLDANSYLTNANGYHTTYPAVHMPNGLNSMTVNENDQEYRNICSGINSLNLDLGVGQQIHDKGSLYSNGYINNVQRTDNNALRSGQQYPTQIINDGSYGSMRNSYNPPSNNGLSTTTTNGINYNPLYTNWSETPPNNDCVKDLFGNYSKLRTCNNADYNLNVALNLANFDNSPPEHIALNDLQQQLNCNLSPNSHNASVLNIHDSYNATANNQGYRPSSTVTDLSADSSFLSNSPLQHFSSTESVLQNCFANNIQRGKFEEYKDYHETSNLNVGNISACAEQLYLKQQHNPRICKLDDASVLAAEQTYKRLLNHYPNLAEQQHQQQYMATTELESNVNCMPVTDQRFDATLLKMLSPKVATNNTVKTREKQVFSPVGYSRNLAAAAAAVREAEQLQQIKFKYPNANDCQRFIINNAEAFKAIQQQNSQSVFQNNAKRSNNISNAYKMKAAYELANGLTYPTNNTLGHQQQSQHLNMGHGSNGIENEIFNRIVKQRQQQQQQQQQRMKNIPSAMTSAADVLYNAGLMQGANTGMFPAHSVMPIPVAVPSQMSLFDNGMGLRNGNSARRFGPSRILFLRLEQTYEQFRQLEKERKKCEAGLAAHFPGKKVTSANNIPIPRLQGSPSKVDRLIIDHFREHARVITLIAKMERLRGAVMNQRVHKAMEHWFEAIKFVQERRKQEISNVTKRQKENLHCISIHDDHDILALAESIYKLTKAARFARTAMYNAMQSTILYSGEIETKIIETKLDVLQPQEQTDNASETEMSPKATTSQQDKVMIENAEPVALINNEEVANRT